MRKKNLIAGIVLLCLIIIYGLLKSGIFEPKTLDTPNAYESKKAIFKSESDDIVGMKIANPSGEFSFEKEGKNWVYTKQPEIELDQNRVYNLAWDYLTVTPSDTLAGDNLEQYGLTNPQATITLVDKQKTETVFLFGNSCESGYYFMMKGNPDVYIISSLMANNILNSFPYYRNSVLFTTAEESLKKVCYRVGDTTYEIKRKNQQWEMVKPYPRGVYSYDFSEQFLTPALSLSIGEFYDDMTPEECGLSNPAYTLQLSGDKEADVLLIGNENESGLRYAMWEKKGKVFGIAKDALAFLETSPLAFMQLQVYLPYIDTVQSFEGQIQGNPFSMKIDRSGETPAYYFNQEKVESSFWKKQFQVLLTAEIIDFISEADVNQDPVISYTATLTDGTKTEIAFYPFNERNYAVSYNGTISFVVTKDTVDTLIENF